MSSTQNILSLDVGERRIGVALASMEARIASPLLTINRSADKDVFGQISEVLNEHNIKTLVVGLPRGMSGQETQQTSSVRKFAASIEEVLNVKVNFQDEALTSVVAEEELKLTGKDYSKGDVDKLAAAIILNDWLQDNTAKVLS